MFKNIIDAMMAGLVWWAWGFAFAYGDVNGGFIGSRYFLGIGVAENDQTANWWF